jgi:ParB-like chromosome segregation protein Spo0J
MSAVAAAPAKKVERLRDLGDGRRDLIMLDPRKIVVEPGLNPRDYKLQENLDHLNELKASIRASGTLQPLWVRFDVKTKAAVLVDGECRLRANLELIADGEEIVAVPCVQVSGMKPNVSFWR